MAKYYIYTIMTKDYILLLNLNNINKKLSLLISDTKGNIDPCK